ncbi:MAG: hypothetical protein JNM39_14765 [Bdellovibrionaceae bacterium]|nr:hypothetical protein [Pseudobdellovibrionaceae bacterium]
MERLLFSVIISFASLSYGDTFFPTRKELLSMPVEVRKKWLKQIQAVLVEMAESSDHMALLTETRSGRSPASAADDKKRTYTEQDYRHQSNLVMQKPKASLAEKEQQRPTPENERQKRFRALMLMSIPERQALLKEEVAKAEADQIQKEAKAEADQKSMGSVSEFRKSEIDYLNKSAAPEREYLCMFAGWILKGPKCIGPSKMPDNLKFRGIENAQLTCQKGSFLCNPILFGVRLPRKCNSLYFHNGEGDSPCLKKAKPLCAQLGSGSPTRECRNLSKDFVDTAVELIGDGNPEAFDQYRGQFLSLCDEESLKSNQKITDQKNAERLRSDVQKTCEVARSRLEEIRDKYEKYIPLPPKGTPTPPVNPTQ